MYWFDQGPMHHLGLDSCEEHGNGCGGCRHPAEVWNVFIPVLGGEVERNPAAGYVLRHYPSVWATEEAIQRNIDEVHG